MFGKTVLRFRGVVDKKMVFIGGLTGCFISYYTWKSLLEEAGEEMRENAKHVRPSGRTLVVSRSSGSDFKVPPEN